MLLKVVWNVINSAGNSAVTQKDAFSFFCWLFVSVIVLIMSIPAGRIHFFSLAWDTMQEVSFAHEKK